MTDISDAIKTALEARRDAALQAGNDGQAKKWEAEIKALTLPAYGQALAEIGFDPARLDTLAIYATQKIRRLVAASLGAGGVDPYTKTLIANARGLGVLANKAMIASLTGNVATGLVLPERRDGSEGTASTQASSTRQALLAIGAGIVHGKGKDASFELVIDHPLVRGIA